MRIELPINVRYILDKLYNSGFQGYVVGGCVRDSLLSIKPHDWDICTNAKPDEIESVFKLEKTINVGKKYGTIAVLIHGTPYEVTTFRADGNYADCRRPESVEFVSELKEDLSRRDFTMNAMAYSPYEGFVDYFGGEKDLRNNTLKCVGDANDRFQEDALRMIRAVRFALRYNLTLNLCTEYAIYDNSSLIKNISRERIHSELMKMAKRKRFSGYNMQVMSALFQLLKEFIPEYADITYEQAMKIAELWSDGACAHTDEYRISVLLLPTNMIDHYLRLLKFSNSERKTVSYIRMCAYDIMNALKMEDDEYAIARFCVGDYGIDVAYDAIGFARATYDYDNLCWEGMDSKLDKVSKGLDEIELRHLPCSVKDLNISGQDIINLGVPEGLEVGLILNKVLHEVIYRNLPNRKEDLLKEAMAIGKRLSER